MRFLLIVAIGVILSACGECRYGNYGATCAGFNGDFSQVQKYVIANNITFYRAESELLDCKRKGYNGGHSSYEQGYQAGDVSAASAYCMAKKGYWSNTNKYPKSSKEESLRRMIEWYENSFREQGKEHLIIR